MSIMPKKSLAFFASISVLICMSSFFYLSAQEIEKKELPADTRVRKDGKISCSAQSVPFVSEYLFNVKRVYIYLDTQGVYPPMIPPNFPEPLLRDNLKKHAKERYEKLFSTFGGRVIDDLSCAHKADQPVTVLDENNAKSLNLFFNKIEDPQTLGVYITVRLSYLSRNGYLKALNNQIPIDGYLVIITKQLMRSDIELLGWQSRARSYVTIFPLNHSEPEDVTRFIQNSI